MQAIEAILLEPVGCLAEFPVEPFHEIAVRFFGRKGKPSPSASRSYWHLLNLMESAATPFDEQERATIEALEAEAVESASMYEDVAPALAELQSMGIRLLATSSLSKSALTAFLERNSLSRFISGVWSRDDAGGVKTAPLERAIQEASLTPKHVMFITDALAGLKIAESVGVQPVLMMNDPDESMRLAMQNPAGGIVSFHELPDFVRLVALQAANQGVREAT